MTRVSITRKINVRDPSTLPAWVPEPGTFANISTNTVFQVRPTGWPTGENAGPFANWSSGVYCPDFGVSGGYAVHGSGHLTTGTPVWAGVWVFDLDSLQWVGRNVPAEPLLEYPPGSAYYNSFYESLDADTLGHPYAPHTYDGLIYQTTAQGGGTDGSLIRVGIPGASGTSDLRVVHAFDLSSATAPPTRVVNSLTGTDYPATAVDEVRGGFWAVGYNMNSGLRFVSFADWSVTAYPSVAANISGDPTMAYVPDRDCLVVLARTNGAFQVIVCPIVGGVPQGWTVVAQAGTKPTDSRAGLVWSTILECLVSYQGVPAYTSDLTPGYDIYKLPVPANLTTGTWTWAKETLSGAGGAEPIVTRDGNNAIQNNGAWGRFVEVPSARCFLYAGSINGPVQAWRPLGT